MPTRRRLKGRTIAALAADGFEKVELIVPLRALKTAGAKVEVVSLRRGRIRGVNLHMPASRVRVDKTIGEADPGDYDGLLLPGGFINPDLLRQSAPAREFVRAFADVASGWRPAGVSKSRPQSLAIPNGSNMLWKPSVNAICSRAGSSCIGSPEGVTACGPRGSPGGADAP